MALYMLRADIGENSFPMLLRQGSERLRSIEELLKEHKDRRAQLDTIQARIEAYRIALMNPEIRNSVYYVSPGASLGMPRNDSNGSLIEKAVMTEEAICEGLRSLISTEESRAAHIKGKVEPVEIALAALTAKQRFVVECRYFDELDWRDTEKNYNDKFSSKDDYISEHGLKKIKDKALSRLENILFCR